MKQWEILSLPENDIWFILWKYPLPFEYEYWLLLGQFKDLTKGQYMIRAGKKDPKNSNIFVSQLTLNRQTNLSSDFDQWCQSIAQKLVSPPPFRQHIVHLALTKEHPVARRLLRALGKII